MRGAVPPKAQAKSNVQCKTTHKRRHILARRLSCHCDVHTVCMHKHVTTQFPQFDASFVMRCRQSCCHLHFWSCYIVRMVTNFDHSTVKHARQNIENDCHQWLSRSFAPYCTLYLLVTKNKVVFLRSVCCNIFFLTRANRRASLSRQHTT